MSLLAYTLSDNNSHLIIILRRPFALVTYSQIRQCIPQKQHHSYYLQHYYGARLVGEYYLGIIESTP